MKTWTKPDRPAELAERRVIEAILEGDFPPNSTLPGERDLAAQLGVTRPTLREALQRLGRDGWVEIRHGRPTRIKDFWREGNLGALNLLVQYPQAAGEDWVFHLWRVRAALAPAYTEAAVEQSPGGVKRILLRLEPWPDAALQVAVLDWRWNYQVSVLTGNPIYTMILNSLAEAWIAAGQSAFSQPQAIHFLAKVKESLLHAAESADGPAAAQACREGIAKIIQSIRRE